MISTPSALPALPILPAPALPTQAVALPTASVTLDTQLQALLDALKTQSTLAVQRVDVDNIQQLLTLLTPQGSAQIKLAQTPTTTSDILAKLASLPPAAQKNLLLQLNTSSGTPQLMLLFNPQSLNINTAPTNAPATTPQNIFLTPLPNNSSAQGLLARLTTLIESLITRLTGRVPTPAAATLNTAAPVELLSQPTADSMQATLIGSTPKGDAIIRTADSQTFTLPTIKASALNSTLYVRNTTSAPTLDDALLLNDILNEVTELLNTINPTLAAQFSRQMQATPGPQMGGAMLLLLGVLTGGALVGKPAQRQFMLDDALDKILPAKIKGKLISTLNEESVRRLMPATDMQGNEWKGFILPTPPLPHFSGPVWVHVQQPFAHEQQTHEQSSSGDDSRKTRFVIDLDLSRLGHTQVEGIAMHKRMDLKINTGTDLPAAAQQELKNVYSNSLSAYGLMGQLQFTTDEPVDLQTKQQINSVST